MELLINLGKRTEKILYSGIFVMAITWSFNYFSKAVSFTQNSNPQTYRDIYEGIQNNFQSLNAAYKNMSNKSQLEDPLEQNKNNKTRKMLGLEPKKKEGEKRNQYKEELNEILNKASTSTGMEIKSLTSLWDYNKSPEELLKIIADEEKNLSSQSINIWGIESPARILFNYGGSNYIITNSLAATLLAFIAPILIIIWIGSFYLTRHREISIIDNIEDYRFTHPHILNLFHINIEKTSRSYWENRFINPKKKKIEKIISIQLISIFRATFMLIFLLLVVFPYINGVFSLIIDVGNSIIITTIHILLILTIIFQSILTIAQEKKSLNRSFETKIKDY